MPVDPELLNQVRQAEARVVDAEHEAEVAQAGFHRAVRRLQLAGASFREIAEVLGLSHQRVHQIVEGAGGGRRWRHRAASPEELQACSFCGKSQKKVKALISGPGVFICDTCISDAHKVQAVPGRAIVTPLATIRQVGEESRTERCSFCGKRRHEVSAMASAGAARICDECLRLCREIRREQLT